MQRTRERTHPSLEASGGITTKTAKRERLSPAQYRDTLCHLCVFATSETDPWTGIFMIPLTRIS